jgi:type VI secretion system Hcp family effector
MNNMKISAILIMALAIVVGTDNAGAAVGMGSAFTYQGSLTDNGSPAEGLYDLRFTLYDEPEGGMQKGAIVTIEDLEVTQGGLTVNLDFTDEPDVLNGEARWLEVSVRPGEMSGPGVFTTLSPRQEITGAPYSQYAKYAGGVWDPEGGGGGGGAATNVWMLGGNRNTTPGTHFVGTKDNKALEFKANNTRIMRLQDRPLSPNIIAGSSNNQITSGVYGATISGGGSVQMNWPNLVTDHLGTISGGWKNQVGDNAGTTDDHQAGAVGGGIGNSAGGTAAAIAGGNGNTANGDMAAIGGGISNIANGHAATVPGGGSNQANGDMSFAAGHRAKANHEGSFVWADSQSEDFASTANNQVIIRAAGGVGIGAPPTGSSILEVEGRVQAKGFKMTTNPTAGYVLTSDNSGIGTWQATGTSSGGGNTLDAAYDQGGAGAGRTITADKGPVRIIGSGGLDVFGAVGIGTPPPTTAKLEVKGTIYSSTGGYKFPDGSIQQSASIGDGFSLDSPDGAHTDVITVDNNGDVNIGTPNPGGDLAVEGSIRAKSGGFVFPDGSVQESAMLPTGPEYAGDNRWLIAMEIQSCPGSWNDPGLDLEGASKVIDLEWSVEQPFDPSTGMPSGHRQHKKLTITKNIDRASPILAKALCDGRDFQDVVLSFYWIDTVPVLYYKIILRNGFVVNFGHKMRYRGNGEYVHLDEVSFIYEEIVWEWLTDSIVEMDSW